MTDEHIHDHVWPEGVPFEVRGYDKALFSILDDSAREYPDAVYTIFDGAVRTFSQVRDTADRVANFLVSRGIRPGDRIAAFLPNIPQYPAIFFGILKAGAVCVTCNPMYKSNELNFQLKDSGARAVFVMDHELFYTTACEAIVGTDVETVVICNIKSSLPPVKRILGSILGKIPKAKKHNPDHFMFDREVKRARPEPPAVTINSLEDYALILYTGGTTGVPKGACLTHANLLSDVMILHEWIRLGKDNQDNQAEKIEKGGLHTFLGVLPWYHAFGLTLCMLLSSFTASRLVCVPDPRAGKPPFTNMLKFIEKYRVTIMVAVPTIFSAILNHPLAKKFDLSSLMACGSGAFAITVDVVRQFEELTGSIIFEGYGLTETSPVITANPTNRAQRKVGTVGLCLPGVEIKILDIKVALQEMPQGKNGEIAVCGPQVMSGYWNKPDENDLVFREIDGKKFFLTGDIGYLDDDGYVVIADRKKDMILVGGFNVYPAEVEDALLQHPDVAMAAVIGVTDSQKIETVKAFIQLKADSDVSEDDIKMFCKSKIVGYKCPKEIEFREKLPVSVIGKVLRRELRE